ncbi:hypothetical protein LTR36_004732 [Oleoguttula mirabilis]|uniref:Uncharacterized protein n=1 Tax=Oleoguttula mirabilis TaxID=1507867 RepID=A0AAV9JGL9_9PEZI|nr:hypothetical protein LTR36_004732 [Oleoguttula mirabilis]
MVHLRSLAAVLVLALAVGVKQGLAATTPSSSAPAVLAASSSSPTTEDNPASLGLDKRTTHTVFSTTYAPLGGPSPTSPSGTCRGSPSTTLYFPNTTVVLAKAVVTGPNAAARISECLGSDQSSSHAAAGYTKSTRSASGQGHTDGAATASTHSTSLTDAPPPMRYPLTACTVGDKLVSCGPKELSFGAPHQSVHTDVTTTGRKRDISTSVSHPNDLSAEIDKRDGSVVLYYTDVTLTVASSQAFGPNAASAIAGDRAAAMAAISESEQKASATVATVTPAASLTLTLAEDGTFPSHHSDGTCSTMAYGLWQNCHDITSPPPPAASQTPTPLLY